MPNVQVVYAEGTHEGVLVTQRDIEEGEELCINYIDTEQGETERGLDLQHYGFQCTCGRCARERQPEGDVDQ